VPAQLNSQQLHCNEYILSLGSPAVLGFWQKQQEGTTTVHYVDCACSAKTSAAVNASCRWVDQQCCASGKSSKTAVVLQDCGLCQLSLTHCSQNAVLHPCSRFTGSAALLAESKEEVQLHYNKLYCCSAEAELWHLHDVVRLLELIMPLKRAGRRCDDVQLCIHALP
jgi:hypothetical protein